MFFWSFEVTMTWIAVLSAMEAASGSGLGYIDYKTKMNGDSMMLAMRKKRMAFSKFPIIMSSIAMLMVNTPSNYCLLPLMASCAWTSLKMGT
jgi:hypothetical protein